MFDYQEVLTSTFVFFLLLSLYFEQEEPCSSNQIGSSFVAVAEALLLVVDSQDRMNRLLDFDFLLLLLNPKKRVFVRMKYRIRHTNLDLLNVWRILDDVLQDCRNMI